MGFQAQLFSDKRLYEHFGSVLSRSLIGNYKGKPMRGALQTPVNPQPEAFKGPEVPLHFSDRSPNFFINTRTPAELPQRGHNKQKRGDLRQDISGFQGKPFLRNALRVG